MITDNNIIAHFTEHQTPEGVLMKMTTAETLTTETTTTILTKIGNGAIINQAYLPSYVDDVIEGYKSGANFYENIGLTVLLTGTIGKIYIDLTTGQSNKQYRFVSGTGFIQITNGLIASTNDVTEGSNLYFTTARVLSTLLTGISFTVSTALEATDSFLVAFGKIQKQLTDGFTAANIRSLLGITTLSGVNTGDLTENNILLSHEFLAATSSNDFVNVFGINSGVVSNSPSSVITPNNIGAGRFTSSTTANSGGVARSGGLNFILKGGEIYTEIINPALFTNTIHRGGLHDCISHVDANNGIYFEYSGSGVLILKTANNGTRSSASLTTLSLGLWYKLKYIVSADATSVTGYVFNNLGNLIATSSPINTNIPTTSRYLNVCSISTHSGTTIQDLVDIDYMSLKPGVLVR